MTFLEAALDLLRREGKPLHYKELTERALGKKLLTFVGRTPEVTMQTQLTAAVKKAPGNPFVRVKPGVFGLLRYPELSAEEKDDKDEKDEKPARETKDRKDAKAADGGARGEGARRRRRRRGGRGRGRGEEQPGAETTALDENGEGEGEGGDESEPATMGGLSAEARTAALAESGVLEADDEASADMDDE